MGVLVGPPGSREILGLLLPLLWDSVLLRAIGNSPSFLFERKREGVVAYSIGKTLWGRCQTPKNPLVGRPIQKPTGREPKRGWTSGSTGGTKVKKPTDTRDADRLAAAFWYAWEIGIMRWTPSGGLIFLI